MANRSNESDEFYQRNTLTYQLSQAGFEESDERIVRRSDLIALERKIPLRRSSTVTTDKPILVQGKAKRKRRPPKIPWKKPAGMPKRPLSAYNLFFAYERERLLKEAAAKNDAQRIADKMAVDTDVEASPKAGGSSDDASDQSKGDFPTSPAGKKASSRRHTRTSGIGFENLTKTIASAWNALDDEKGAIFVGRAASEKERYQAKMKIYRAKEEKAKPESATDGDGTKTKSKPKVLKRRQSSPPDARTHAAPQPTPDSPPSHLSTRRASEPIYLNNSAFSFSFDRAISPHESESSNWAEPMDGGSLGSADQQDWESTLKFDMTSQGIRPTPHRSYSDSMLHIQPDNYDIRPCEELATDLGMMHGGATAAMAREEAKETNATLSSLQALQASLDDDMVDFITTLSKAEG